MFFKVLTIQETIKEEALKHKSTLESHSNPILKRTILMPRES